MDDTAIKVENVSKVFKLPHEKSSSVKSLVVNSYRRNKGYDLQKALNDVSLEVKKGEFFGIVGRNGSGKSTLLKLLAGIYTPTSGTVEINGSLTPFIELGVGFNAELTGRENVYLNGALLGFNRKEMRAMYNDIVEFAELKKFMDQKLKNYSSGMQVRLAFAIAIRAKSDILILDEVLAVGDEAFQQKCIDVFESYKSKNQTVVLVTHDMEMIRRFCTKAVMINDGQIVKAGDPSVVAAEYSKLNSEDTERDLYKKNRSQGTSLIKLKITSPAGASRTIFNMYDDMRVDISWPKETPGVKNVGLAIHKNSGEYIFGDNTFGEKKKLTKNEISYSVKLDVGPGKYHLVAGIFGDKTKDVIEFEQHGPEFMVKATPTDRVQGLVRLRSKWNYDK